MWDAHIILKFYGGCNWVKAGTVHFKEDYCTQDSNHCQPIYLQFILKQVFFPAVLLKMCCLGIREMQFLDFKNAHTAVRYYFHWSLGIFPLLCYQQPIWWLLFKVSHLGLAVLFTCIKQKGLLSCFHWNQKTGFNKLSIGNMGELVPSTICFPSYLARVFSSSLMVMLPQPPKKAAFPDLNDESSILWANLNRRILCENLTSCILCIINNTCNNCIEN